MTCLVREKNDLLCNYRKNVFLKVKGLVFQCVWNLFWLDFGKHSVFDPGLRPHRADWLLSVSPEINFKPWYYRMK